MSSSSEFAQQVAGYRARLPSTPTWIRSDEHVDPDPATTRNPDPDLSRVRVALETRAPHCYGGIYRTLEGTIHVGLTDCSRSSAGMLVLAELSEPRVVVFPVEYALHVLQALADAVTEAFATDLTVPITSIGIDVKTNQVAVGFSDPTTPAAEALRQHYGRKVRIFEQAPIEPL